MRLGNSLPQTIQHWAQSSLGALSSGFAGLLNSSDQHQQASDELLNGGLGRNSEQSGQLGGSGVTVQISHEYRQKMNDVNGINTNLSTSVEDSVASINEAGVTYSASAKIVKASSAMIDAFFDAIA